MKNEQFPRELNEILIKWEKDFKCDLKESMQNDINNGLNLKQSLEILLFEHFPIWIEESKQDKNLVPLYNKYKGDFKKVYLKI